MACLRGQGPLTTNERQRNRIPLRLQFEIASHCDFINKYLKLLERNSSLSLFRFNFRDFRNFRFVSSNLKKKEKRKKKNCFVFIISRMDHLEDRMMEVRASPAKKQVKILRLFWTLISILVLDASYSLGSIL